MGGLLSLRLLAGLLYDLTTAEIRLQRTHVWDKQSGTVGPAFILLLLARSLSFRPRLSLSTWNLLHLQSIFSFTLKHASLVSPFSQTQGCVICVSCLWMTLHGKNESPLESLLFFFSHSQFFSTYLSLSSPFCFPSVTTAKPHFFAPRQDTQFKTKYVQHVAG